MVKPPSLQRAMVCRPGSLEAARPYHTKTNFHANEAGLRQRA